jgi:hypothetical protein
MKPYSKYFEKIRVRPRPRGRGEVARAALPVGRLRRGRHAPRAGRPHARGRVFQVLLRPRARIQQGLQLLLRPADSEIARFQKEALTGHARPGRWASTARRAPRPTSRSSGRAAPATTTACATPSTCSAGHRRRQPRERKAKPLEAKALETLGLDVRATWPTSRRATRNW